MKLKEIGSNFHNCIFPDKSGDISFPVETFYYGCGRYAINDLISYHLERGLWKRIFIPEYFCYEVVDSIRSMGIEVMFYPDHPLAQDEIIINRIKFKSNDVLLRMNYFGWRIPRDNSRLNVTVIEDHSHNLFSDWALESNADWCIASLRKTLPIPDGGIVWSPKNNCSLLEKPSLTWEHSELAAQRLRAMEIKSKYLFSDNNVSKDDFLSLFNQTESLLGREGISSLSDVSKKMIGEIPEFINEIRGKNHSILSGLITANKCKIQCGDNSDIPFSLILLFESREDRDRIRSKLIEKNVYSNILWEIQNDNACEEVKDFSRRMLSLPIDFRYSNADMHWMSEILNTELSIL